MAAPNAPTLLRPAAGEIVIPTLPIFLLKSPFSDPDAGTIANEIKAATTDEGGDWTDPAYLRTGSGLQNTMASATALGKSQILSWSGMTFTGASTARVKDVKLRLRAMATWAASPGNPGNTEVRAVLSYQRVRKHIVINMLCRSQQWVGGVVPVPADGLFTTSIDSWLRTLLGSKYTLGDLAAAAADLRVLVSTWAGLDHYVTAWKAGPAQMSVDYWSAEPSRQTAYQFDIARDSAFSDLNFSTGQNAVEIDSYTVAPMNLDQGASLYGRAKQKDATAFSAWSSTVAFSTLAAGASRLITEEGAHAAIVYELEACRWLDASGWSKTGGRTYVYQHALVRGSELSQNWWISDIEEEGIRGGYAVKATTAEVDAAASSYYHDEAAGVLYVRTSDGRNPGAFKGIGIGLLVAIPIAQAWITAGPGEAWTFEGRILGKAPDIEESIEDLAGGVGASASGMLRISNFDNLYDRLLGDGDPSADPGLLFNNRRVTARLIGSTSAGMVPYAQALTLWNGMAKWSSRGTAHERREISLSLAPRDVISPDASLAELRYSVLQYPNVHKTWDGKAIQEVIGLGHLRAECAVVDTVNKVLRPGLSVSIVRALYLDGALYPAANWSYDSAKNHISILAGGAPTWSDDKDKSWSFDGDGALFEGSASMTPGRLARYLLSRAGLRSSEVYAASFALIDAAAPYELRFIAEDDLKIRDAMLTTCRSGRLHLVHRTDGQIEAIPGVLSTPYATTPVFEDGDLIGDPVTSEEQDSMGSWCEVEYWGYPNESTRMATWSAGTWLTKPWHQREGVKKIETYHATFVGAEYASRSVSLSVPYRHVTIRVGRRGLAAGVGKSVILNLSEARDPDGLYRNDLFQVRRRRIASESEVELELRHVRTLGGYEGPF